MEDSRLSCGEVSVLLKVQTPNRPLPKWMADLDDDTASRSAGGQIDDDSEGWSAVLSPLPNAWYL